MEKYYIIFEKWNLEVNQWTILFGIITALIGVIGFSIAFYLYFKQRADNANDAFELYNNSLPNLNSAVIDVIKNLEEFVENLKTEKFSNPIISTSLNNNILNKINIIDLKRYYSFKLKNKLLFLEQFVIDSDFFGTYQNYFSNELNFFREKYLSKEEIYSKWQLLRSNIFFSTITDENEEIFYKDFYSHWVTRLNDDKDIFNFSEEGNPTSLKSRKNLIQNYIRPLAMDIFPFIERSEKANQVNLLANQVNSAYLDMEEITSKLVEVFERDIAKFREISFNIEKLI